MEKENSIESNPWALSCVHSSVCDFTEPRVSMESTGDDLADWMLWKGNSLTKYRPVSPPSQCGFLTRRAPIL